MNKNKTVHLTETYLYVFLQLPRNNEYTANTPGVFPHCLVTSYVKTTSNRKHMKSNEKCMYIKCHCFNTIRKTNSVCIASTVLTQVTACCLCAFLRINAPTTASHNLAQTLMLGHSCRPYRRYPAAVRSSSRSRLARNPLWSSASTEALPPQPLRRTTAE